MSTLDMVPLSPPFRSCCHSTHSTPTDKVICIHLVLGNTSIPTVSDPHENEQKINDSKDEDKWKVEDTIQPQETRDETPRPQYDGFNNAVSYMNFFRKAGFLDEEQEGSETFKNSPFLKRFRNFLSQEINRELAPSESVQNNSTDSSVNFSQNEEKTQESLVPSNTTVVGNEGKNASEPAEAADAQVAADSSGNFRLRANAQAAEDSSNDFLKLQADIEREALKIQNKASASNGRAVRKKMDGTSPKEDFSDIEYPSSDDDYPDINDIPTNAEVPSYKSFAKTYDQNGYYSPNPDRPTSSFGLEQYHIPKSQVAQPKYPGGIHGSESFNNFEYPSLKQKVYSTHPYSPSTGRSLHGAPQVNEDMEEVPEYGDPSDFIGIGQYPSDYVIQSAEEPESEYYDEEKQTPGVDFYAQFAPKKKKKTDEDEDDYDLGDDDDEEEEEGEKKDKDEYYDERGEEPDTDYTNVVHSAVKSLPEQTRDLEPGPSSPFSMKLKPEKHGKNESKKQNKKSLKKFMKSAPMILPVLPILPKLRSNNPKPIKHCTLKNKTVVEPQVGENANRTADPQRVACYLCVNFENGEKSEQCVNSTRAEKAGNHNASLELKNETESAETAKKRVVRQVVIRRWVPEEVDSGYRRAGARRAPRRDIVDKDIDFDFDHAGDAGEDLENDELDFFSDEDDERSSDVDEYLPPAETLREMQDGSCKKVRKNGLNCLVCEKPNSAGTFEQCSYESDPKENAYEYSTKETYGSRNKPYNERYRRSKTPERHERIKKDINLGRKSPFDSGLLSRGGASDFGGRSKGSILNSRNNGFNSNLGGKSYSLSGTSDDGFTSNVFSDVNVPGQSKDFGQDFSDLDSAIKPESGFLPKFGSKSSLNSGTSLFNGNKRPSLFDNRPQLRLKPEKNSYDSLLGDFTAKDRSHCKKEIRDGATCYYCTDDEGSEHEECMYVKKSQPENKEVKYHQTKEVKTPLRGHKAANKFDEILNSNSANKPVYRENSRKLQRSAEEDTEDDEIFESPFDKEDESKPSFQTTDSNYADSPAVSTVSRTDFQKDENPTFYHYDTRHGPHPKDEEPTDFPTPGPSITPFGSSDTKNFPARALSRFEESENESNDSDPAVENEFPEDAEPEVENTSNVYHHQEARSDDDIRMVYDNEFKMTLPRFMVEKTPQEKEFDNTYRSSFKKGRRSMF